MILMSTGGIVGVVIGCIAAAILFGILISSVKIVKQTDKYVVERMGAYLTTWTVGIHFLVPFFDRVRKVVSMKEQIYDFPPQPVITKDNVTMQIDTIVFFTVTDPKLYAYGVENPIKGIEALSSTTLRNVIGELDLDGTLTSRDIINNKMRSILDDATDPWGIKVTRVEVKNIMPPKEIRDAMERQMRAERERREKILLAEGTKSSAILIAEGNKESAILNAEAEKQAAIKRAEAEAESITKVKKAQADGELMIRAAEAKGIQMMNDSKPSKEVITLKSFETFAKVADGKATKIIVPSELQNIATLATTIAEVAGTKKAGEEDITKDDKKEEVKPEPKKA